MRRGQGVAITTTARNRSAVPPISQPITPISNANGVYQAPRRSAMRRMLGRFCSASSTTFRMRV